MQKMCACVFITPLQLLESRVSVFCANVHSNELKSQNRIQNKKIENVIVCMFFVAQHFQLWCFTKEFEKLWSQTLIGCIRFCLKQKKSWQCPMFVPLTGKKSRANNGTYLMLVDRMIMSGSFPSMLKGWEQVSHPSWRETRLSWSGAWQADGSVKMKSQGHLCLGSW